ncbi:MAG TPA: 4Fe-4S binding protein [Firmicutes bacterium]|nr:4Fe-4S binding protein [Bacillota bacterium]
MTVNENVCKGCGLCVSVCPKKIIRLSPDRLNAKGYSPAEVVKPEECIGCAMCGIMCPDSAITVER